MGLVTVGDVRAARDVLKDVVQYTPLAHSRVLEHRVGSPVYFKCENLQRAGSFKIRGAYLRISRLTDAERARGVVAASAGNHAQGVALAASLLGAKSTVFMPHGAPLPKMEATKAYGAAIEIHGESVDEALQAAQQYAEDHGAVLIHPFNHPDVVAGQGTVGLEILEQCPDVRTILVGAGGGGLVSGISVAVKALAPQVRVVAVQAEGAAAFPGSLAAGHPVALESMSTMADGIAIGRPGDVTFAHVQALVDDVVTVSEESLSRALLLCLERSKLVVEPAGVASVAALMDEPHRYAGPVVAVLSGGNIDPLLLSKVIQHGLISAGRFLSFRLSIPDRPGELARLLGEIASEEANVLSVEHSRTGSQLRLGEVEIGLSVETKGEAHSRAMLETLRAGGRVLVFS